MSTTTTHRITDADLDGLWGEVLPTRVLLSAVGHGPGAIAYACQYTHSPGTLGLLGTGLLAEPEYTTRTCVPIVVDHAS
ncbi:MAG TPA: hypothetical protein VIL71_18030 [Spirillospora sp.]